MRPSPSSRWASDEPHPGPMSGGDLISVREVGCPQPHEFSIVRCLHGEHPPNLAVSVKRS